MTQIIESSAIPGVKLVKFRVFSDSRGQFMETFRKDWFPERSWEIIQSNRSESAAGVLRGLHFHHHQVDYWQVVNGSIRVALADLRRQSPTYGQVETIDLDAANPMGLFIPVGVAHGFLACTAATLLYLVDNYYDGSDEHGIAWNDPDLAIPWGIQTPTLSDRDCANPTLRAIGPERLP
ncbi:MAG: dTDP-4-dehydrorhamnose 3,5-epimerase family protein [Caldilineaceae bacterium]|nr:dTDP-4-dehydrorhamnose 3,5-epimerase family protein [Caldilineaceae bacterium]